MSYERMKARIEERIREVQTFSRKKLRQEVARLLQCSLESYRLCTKMLWDQRCRYKEKSKRASGLIRAAEADRDEALQWIRELLPYVEASLSGALNDGWLAECRQFLERER